MVAHLANRGYRVKGWRRAPRSKLLIIGMQINLLKLRGDFA
jgi:hypothetical protein